MLCAKAQRSKPATRSSVFWGVRPSGSVSFYKCRALKHKSNEVALKRKKQSGSASFKNF